MKPGIPQKQTETTEMTRITGCRLLTADNPSSVSSVTSYSDASTTRPTPHTSGRTLAFGLIAVLLTGCSGINASKSVSPLDFLLPGLHMRNDPPTLIVPSVTNTLVCRHYPPMN